MKNKRFFISGENVYTTACGSTGKVLGERNVTWTHKNIYQHLYILDVSEYGGCLST
jgi:hypothetical protein